MHQSALFFGKRFFEVYCPYDAGAKVVLDIGAQDVNGSLRSVCPAHAKYIGVDFVAGKGVDVILDDPYTLPFETASADVIVCSSCFEHSQFFWLVFLEIMRVLKPAGLFYLNAPSNGFVHKYPVDCWRFYPDAGHAMAEWGRRNGYDPVLLESYVGGRSQGSVAQGGMWNDYVAVFVKDAGEAQRYPKRIIHGLTNFTNGYSSDTEGELHPDGLGPDFALIERLEQTEQSMRATAEQVRDQMDRNLAEQEALASRLKATSEELAAVYQSTSWRLTAPMRRAIDFLRHQLHPQTECGPISKLAIAAFTLPATFAYYRTANGWLQATGKGTAFFGDVLRHPLALAERLEDKPRLLRRGISISVAVGLAIRTHGGLVPTLAKAYEVWRRKGLAGLKMGLKGTLPMGALVVASEMPEISRILVMDYRVPRSDVSAGERATVGILKDLCALRYKVVFLPQHMDSPTEYVASLREFGVEVITPDDGYPSAAHYLAAQAHTFGAFYLIRVDVAESALDIIERTAPAARVIFHLPDVYFIREAREAELKDSATVRLKAEQTRMRELAVIRRADHVVVVSPAEVPVLQHYLPDVSLSVFPALYADIVDQPAPYEARKHLLFLGGFGHSPNIDAATWFVENVWPLIRGRLPDVEFHIVGAEIPSRVAALARVEGVQVRGFVQDLAPLMAQMRIGVAPLRYGAGIKGKVAMMMGAGIPSVCTSIAAEGMDIVDGIHARVEDDPDAFAAAVVDVYTNPALWERLSGGGREIVLRKFGEKANRQSLLHVLQAARTLPLSLFGDYCAREDLVPAIPAFPGAVDVSIIVPVYNKWHLTRACINSILETCSHGTVSFELILADDGSVDETVRAAELYPGLRVVRTDRNVGFLRNCNNAARHAKGRYLLLLNNDTVVLPGWLDSLFQAAERDPRVAIAGSKLLYPDGAVQEAGGILFSDATGCNVGRGMSPLLPLLNLPREVDYISGASILVRKDFWNKTGGFDEQYKNAYCEDSDLAMAARANGMLVVYEPLSEVVHFEHQSYSDQATAQNNNALQAHNTALLREKWRSVLDRDHFNQKVFWPVFKQAMARPEMPVLPSLLAHHSAHGMDILCISPVAVHDASPGRLARRIYQIARRFQHRGHRVHFVVAGSCDASEVAPMEVAWDTFHSLARKGDVQVRRIRDWCADLHVEAAVVFLSDADAILEALPDTVQIMVDETYIGGRWDLVDRVLLGRATSLPAGADNVEGLVVPACPAPRFGRRRRGRLASVGIFVSPSDDTSSLQAILAGLFSERSPGRTPQSVRLIGAAESDWREAVINERTQGRVDIHWSEQLDERCCDELDLLIVPEHLSVEHDDRLLLALVHGTPVVSRALLGLQGAFGSRALEVVEDEGRRRYLAMYQSSLLAIDRIVMTSQVSDSVTVSTVAS